MTDPRDTLKSHIVAVLEGIRHLSVDDAADLLATVHRLLDAIDAERARAEKAEAERDQALARAAAAYELAAEVYWDGFPAWDTFSAAREAIRALTPADAEAALQRVVDVAWNEAVEACAAVFDTHGDSAATEALGQVLCCHGYLCGCQGATVGEYLEHLMRALKRPEASHE